MAMSQAGRGGRRTSDFGFPSARSTVGRRSGSPPKPRPSGLFGGDAAYNTANPPPVGRVPSHGDRFAESLPVRSASSARTLSRTPRGRRRKSPSIITKRFMPNSAGRRRTRCWMSNPCVRGKRSGCRAALVGPAAASLWRALLRWGSGRCLVRQGAVPQSGDRFGLGRPSSGCSSKRITTSTKRLGP
jgi:hypothetical protein